MKKVLKNLKVLFVCALALPFVFQSCNSDSEDQLYALVTLVSNGIPGDFTANNFALYLYPATEFSNTVKYITARCPLFGV